MSSTTVTPAAPVAAPEVVEVSVQERLNHATSKELDTWRKTGDIPEAKAKVIEPPPSSEVKPIKEEAAAAPVVEEPSAAVADEYEPPAKVETAPAPVAGKPQKKDAAARLQEVLAERKKDRELIRQLTEKLTAAPSVTPTSQPAAVEAKPEVKTEGKAKPNSNDVDEQGKPRFKSWAEYEDARDQWNREELLRLVEEKQTATHKSQQVQEAEQVIAKEWNSRINKARERYEDFDAVALNTSLPIKQGSVPDAFILDSEYGADVLYYLGEHQDELTRILTLNPIAQGRELFKIEQKFVAPPAPAKKDPAPAPRPPAPLPPPPREIGARNSAPPDDAEAALARGDTGAYMRIVNARELKARRG